jgi:hypothetical protein
MRRISAASQTAACLFFTVSNSVSAATRCFSWHFCVWAAAGWFFQRAISIPHFFCKREKRRVEYQSDGHRREYQEKRTAAWPGTSIDEGEERHVVS